ncbi:MAG: SDR family NAD(P)-dependent oxidoreductase, partial [Polyangiaceae bacterium]|nr:SDR family NAD(P)-dependent oxidoreductase [Polyangiaceae bacterium]
GRSHALLLASRGAKVVVNDLGGSYRGEGKSSEAADRVVAEIKAAGGEAVANYDSVEDGDKIVQCALDSFGQIDILVNNAGILRDTSFQKMTQADWDLIYRVHVAGVFKTTHAAWSHMRDRDYGRIVMTSSAAGIYGNFGQANYSMAKLGIHGLAQTLAIEGRKKNILVNTIAPIAGSRMTETVLPPDLIEALKPEYVSPLVAYLCHEGCTETGGLFEVGGGFIGKLRWERTQGKSFRLSRKLTPEAVADAWSEITDFRKTTHPSDINSAMAPVMDNLGTAKGKGGNEFIDVDEALGYEFPESKDSYTEKDLALYALAIGAARDALDESELRAVYEGHSQGFVAIPTFGVIPALNAMMKAGQAPGMNYGFDRILHGEQYLELKQPLPSSATLTHKARIKDIFDKGKNAVVVTEVRSFDSVGNEIMRNEITAVVRGAGGWGGDRGPAAEQTTPPDRAPDATITEPTHENQALLYRLTGDINPLHADPSFAGAMGFKRPILHGLCTFGFSARHVIKAFAKNDPRYLRSIKARFSESVYPGETLRTEIWKESDTRFLFRTKVVERDVVVISGGVVEMFSKLPSAKPAVPAQATATSPVQPEATTRNSFLVLQHYVDKNPELAQKIQTVFQFKITNPDANWVVDLKQGKVYEGVDPKADTTLEIADADYLAMASGKANPMALFSSGKLKISGNVMASQKLAFMQKMDRDAALRDAIAAGKLAGTVAPAAEPPVAATPAKTKEAKAPALFQKIREKFDKNPGLAGELGGAVQFQVKNPNSAWILDASGRVKEGTGEAATTVTLSDDDLEVLVNGSESVQSLYQHGKLRVDGDMGPARKLAILRA